MATAFKGVSQAYAIQAGREVRIIVKPEEIDDLEANRLARDIAKKIEETMQYPGQIRVTVNRESRAVDYAKQGQTCVPAPLTESSPRPLTNSGNGCRYGKRVQAAFYACSPLFLTDSPPRLGEGQGIGVSYPGQ